MRNGLGKASRQLWRAFWFSLTLIVGLFKGSRRWLVAASRWFLASRFWRFIGRMGLALRNLLTWFVWQPLFFLLMPVWLPGRWLLDYLKAIAPRLRRFFRWMGRIVLNLLTWLVWLPLSTLLFLPLLWLYRRLARPPFLWLSRQIQNFARRRWQVGAPKRRLYRRRLASRWHIWRARLYVWLKRPKSPASAVIVPRQPRPHLANIRLMRFATVFASIAIVVVVSLINWQERQPVRAIADSVLPRIIIATPSPAPVTPTAVPTPEIVLTPWPTPDPLNEGGNIMFSQRQNGNSDVYVLPVGQAEPVRLTTHPADDRDAVWSPNNREIAFASHRDGNWEIYVYNIPEGKLRRITSDPGYDGKPSWSPDGLWLAYESYQNNNLDVYVVKTDLTQGPFRMTEHAAPDFAPVWSPTGRHVAFTSWRSGNKDIFLRSLDDVFDETAVNLTASPTTHEDAAAFSPDGRYLAYAQDNGGFHVIYALPLADNYVVAGAPISLDQQGDHPGWSPDSESLVFVHERSGTSYLIAGSPHAWGVTPQIYAAAGPIQRPSWSPLSLSPAMADVLTNVDGPDADEPLFVEALAPPAAEGPPVVLWEAPVNAPSPYLSDRVNDSFAALRQQVTDAAGWDFLGQLDNMFEPIDSKPLPGQSNRTWNKAGRAFDLYARQALAFEPQIEVVRQDIGADTYWRVYIRTAAQDGTQGEPLRDLPWNFQARFEDEPQYYEDGGVRKEAIPAGYYVDFTALAADYGWTWVPADKNWRTFFPGIRFWRYENHQGLTWEEAMLELYTEVELARVFGRP